MRMNNHDYPMGSDTKDAPWNEPTPQKQKDFSCVVLHELKKVMKVPTDQYHEYKEKGEDGEYIHEIDTGDVDWNDEYKQNCYTINDLLHELEGYIQDDLKRYRGFKRKEKQLNEMLEACKGWETENIYVEQV